MPDKTKINATYYRDELLSLLLEDCNTLLGNDFIFQQDGALARTARLSQDWLAVNSSDFIGKDEWPPNSPDINPLDYCVWGVMLTDYQKHNPKPTTKAQLREVLQKDIGQFFTRLH